MTPLSPSQKNVLRVRGLLVALVLLVPATVADATFLRGTPIPSGLPTGLALLLGAVALFVTPGRAYRAWGYDATGDELHIQSGIWLRSRTIVPYGRVQHIDVGQGPIERHYGVGTLTLHTAGTSGSQVSLPGLAMADAERMRDDIRRKIRQDMV